MIRSSDSLIPFGAGQPTADKRHDKAFGCRQEGEATLQVGPSSIVEDVRTPRTYAFKTV